MNGRVYDPLTAMFFSPDPYLQSPDNWLNYNRYTYCLNNPFKYVDPDGEVWWLVPVIAAAVFAVGNTAAQAISGDIDNFGDGVKAFFQGAVTGFALGCLWTFTGPAYLGGMSGILGSAGSLIHTSMTVYSVAQAGVGVLGTFAGLGNGWKGMGRGAQAFLGNFYLDENRLLGGMWQGFSRHTWEMIQSFVGHTYTQIRNTAGNVDRVDYLGGATFVTNENAGTSNGVSLGNYINTNIGHKITDDFDDYVVTHPLYMHEYGHTFDSRRFGPSYLFGVGLPSIFSAAGSTQVPGEIDGVETHDFRCYEMQANKHAAKYFEEYYGVDWNTIYRLGTIETYYPRRKR